MVAAYLVRLAPALSASGAEYDVDVGEGLVDLVRDRTADRLCLCVPASCVY